MEFMREFSNGRGFADSVYSHDQNDPWFGRKIKRWFPDVKTLHKHLFKESIGFLDMDDVLNGYFLF